MYLIIMPVIALFLGADDRVGELENKIADLQEKLDAITPDLNNMNKGVEAQEELVAEKRKAFDVYTKQLDGMDREDRQYGTIKYLKDVARDEWYSARSELKPMVSVRDALQLKHDMLLLELELKQKSLDNILESQKPPEKKKFIGITLSQTCERLISVNATTNCPTYGELVLKFDNTNPLVSGKFVEKDNDLRREDTKMKNHWEFYEQKKYGTVIMVDPDNDYKKRAVIVEIQPNDFEVVNVFGGQSKQSAFVNGTIISYTGLYIDEKCKRILSAPDIQRITNTINFATSGCSEQFEINPNVMTLNQTAIDKSIHKGYQYQEWLQNAINNFRNWMVGK
tara:strand:- start:1336 stop:2349 length:1014 start_codon:yes stop_codon:yes gene_type:complete